MFEALGGAWSSVSPLWILFFIIGFVILVPVSLVLFQVLQLTIRWQLHWRKYKGKLRCLPALSYFQIFQPAGLENFINTIYNDGNIEDILLGGAYFNGEPVIMVNNPDEFKKLLNDEEFPKLPATYDRVELLIGKGLVTSKGELWKRQRKLITPIFHFQKLRLIAPVMGENIVFWLEKLRNLKGEKVDPVSVFCDLTLRIVIESAFGGSNSVGCLSSDLLSKLWGELGELLPKYLMTACLIGKFAADYIPFPWVLQYNWKVKQTRKIIQTAIKVKREYILNHSEEIDYDSLDRSDLLFEMLRVRDDNGKAIPDELMIDEAMTFLLAGHETTSNTLAWTCYFLTRNPEVFQNLRNEVDHIVEGSDVFPHLSKLQYCRAVLQETLRLRPPIPYLERIANSDCVLADKKFSKGTYTAIGIIFCHLNPKYFEDPFTFKPERFLNENNVKHPFCYIPFSGGNRNCIGQKFAMQEAVAVLSLLVKNFDIVADLNERVFTSFKTTLTPWGFHCRFVPRYQ